MKLICPWVTGTGAKGKFSGGFDITAFGGLQGGQKGMLAGLCFDQSGNALISTKFIMLLLYLTAEPKPGYISVEVITDTLEGIQSVFFRTFSTETKKIYNKDTLN